MSPSRAAWTTVLLLVLCAAGPITGSSVQQGPPQWRPPLGIPEPAFGLFEVAPPTPSPWLDPVPGFYYVAPSAPGATDADNPLGTPRSPRVTIPSLLPAGAVVEVHGTYDRPHTSPRGIVAAGTATQPVFIRGSSAADTPAIVRPWEVSGSYFVLENLRFRDRDGAATGSLVILAPVHHGALRHSALSGNLRAGGLGIESWDGRSTATDVVIYDNKVHDNGNVAANFDQDRHGIHIGERVSNAWVVDNEMWRNSGDGIQINAGSRSRQSGTHHIYVGRNVSHHNKQNGFWTKQANDIVFSQNVAYAHRPSNSSLGVGLGFQYAPSFVWFLFNRVYDSDFGIQAASDSDLGTGTESFFIGNVIHDIHDSDRDFNPATGWQNCAISLAGGTNRFVVNNTLFDVDSGICSPAAAGKVELHNNIIFRVRSDGLHVFLEHASVARASRASGNLFGPAYRAVTAGVRHEYGPRDRRGAAGNVVVRDAGLDLTPPAAGELLRTSPAIDMGGDDPAEVYALYRRRYGHDIRTDFRGRPRPFGGRWDAGALEFSSAPSPR